MITAVITPTTDFGNLFIIATGPMIALYSAGIGVAWVFGRSRRTGPVRNGR